MDQAAEQTVEDVLQEVERSWGRCAGLYYHGSTIFGNKKPTDIDLLAIVDEPTLKPVKAATTDAQFSLGPFEVSVYTRSFWLRKLEEMDLTMLTCLSLPPQFVVRPLDDERAHGLAIDVDKLAEAIISYAEYTWLKARRVLLRWKDPHKSSKNVYFVFRVLELGRQLVESGRIVNFTAANPWWEHIHGAYESLQIKAEPGDWSVVEAVMASHFQDEVARFQASVTRARQGPAGGAPASEPGAKEEEAPGGGSAPPHEEGPCPVCLEALEAGANGDENRREGPPANLCRLANCRHRFHNECIARTVRSKHPAACPLCRRPVHLRFDEGRAVERELERRGISQGAGRPSAPRRRYGGYPATVLLPEEPTPAEEDATEDAAPPGVQDGAPAEGQLPAPPASTEEDRTAAEGRAPAAQAPTEDSAQAEDQEPAEQATAEMPARVEGEPAEEEEEPAELAQQEQATAEAGSQTSSGSLGDWELVEADAPVRTNPRGQSCGIS